MKPSRQREKASSGFTLLEAILALAVFSLAAVALTEALSMMGLATVESADHAWRLELVESYLEEASKVKRVHEGEQQVPVRGTVMVVMIRTVPLEVRSQDDQGILPDLFEVSVELYRQPGSGGKPILLERASTYRYRHLYGGS